MTMDETERTRGIAEYIADRIAEAVEVYRGIYRDDLRPMVRKCVEMAERNARQLEADSTANPQAFAEEYRRVLFMTPVEIIMDILRKKECT